MAVQRRLKSALSENNEVITEMIKQDSVSKRKKQSNPATIRFSAKTEDELDAAAKRMGVTRNSLVSTAVYEYLVAAGIDPKLLDPKPKSRNFSHQVRAGIGLKVWAERNNQGYSQSKLAELSGVSCAVIVNLETGRKKISEKSTDLILKALRLNAN